MRAIVAVNTAPESENRMHGDEARRYGFAGGLVPGVDVLAYLAHEPVARWGERWLAGGRLRGRLDAPVYDAERVTIEIDGEGAEGFDTRVVGPDGATRASARAELLAGEERARLVARADPHRIPEAPLPAPADRPAASAATLAPGTVLATQRARFSADRARAYLAEISEDHDAFTTGGLAHPGWLLRFANWALGSSVRLGPWIHVASDLALLATVRDGDELEVRAVVTGQYERKAHHFVDLDVVLAVGDAAVAFVEHRAIWQPRPAASG